MMWSCLKSVRVRCLMCENVFFYIVQQITTLYRVYHILYSPNFVFKVWIIVFHRPFFDLLLLPPLNRVVPARYDEELSCAMCGPVTVIKKEKKKKKKKGKRRDSEGWPAYVNGRKQ